jgi:Peptidase family M1 domain
MRIASCAAYSTPCGDVARDECHTAHAHTSAPHSTHLLSSQSCHAPKNSYRCAPLALTGFASWTQTHAANELFPDWAMWEQFITDDQAAALRLDALKTSHPIQVPIAHAEEVEQVSNDFERHLETLAVRMRKSLYGTACHEYLFAQCATLYPHAISAHAWALLYSLQCLPRGCIVSCSGGRNSRVNSRVPPWPMQD